MKIKLLKPLVSAYGQFLEGDIVVVPDHIGQNWVKNGIAESLESVAEEGTVAESVAEEGTVAESVEEQADAPNPEAEAGPEPKPVLRRRKPHTPR